MEDVPSVAPALTCPSDGTHLQPSATGLSCPCCGTTYPVVEGVPILIDEARSVFDVADYLDGTSYNDANAGQQQEQGSKGLKRWYRRTMASLQWAHLPDRHLDAGHAVARMAERIPNPRLLVIGAGLRRYGLPTITYTDVALTRDLTCVCDAHDLPFPDGSFDGVIAAAVLEHVMDPVRCVAEMVRVLRPGGMVYAVTPFLQPVHMGRHDFTRWTYLGHRRLFRHFDDLASGICGGPGSAFALSLRALLMSASDRPGIRRVLRPIGILFASVVMQADRLALRTQAAYDGACAVYFFGAKRETPVPDREILRLFRGA